MFQPKISQHENRKGDDHLRISQKNSHYKKYDTSYTDYPVNNYLGYEISGDSLPLNGNEYPLYTGTQNPTQHYPMYDPNLMYMADTTIDAAIWYNPELQGGSIYFQPAGALHIGHFESSEVTVDELSNYQETSWGKW